MTERAAIARVAESVTRIPIGRHITTTAMRLAVRVGRRCVPTGRGPIRWRSIRVCNMTKRSSIGTRIDKQAKAAKPADRSRRTDYRG